MTHVTDAERYLAELKSAMDYYGNVLDKQYGSNHDAYIDAYVKYDVARGQYNAAKRMMELMKR